MYSITGNGQAGRFKIYIHTYIYRKDLKRLPSPTKWWFLPNPLKNGREKTPEKTETCKPQESKSTYNWNLPYHSQ